MRFIMTILILAISISGCTISNSTKKTPATDNWAIYNSGQTVDGSKGVIGVDINAIPAWEITKGTPDIIIAVVDSGVDISGKQLSNSIFINKSDPMNSIDDDENGYIDDYYGWNFHDMNCEIYNDALYDYHGTYVTNTILEVAPQISILPVKFLSGISGNIKNAVKAIDYAISRGAKIINCSWNFNEYDKDLFEIIKSNPQVLFVCAAANSNIDLNKDSVYPCSYNLDNIITVMSVDNSGSPYGASGYGDKIVDVAAPGVHIPVIFPDYEKTEIDGTSVSCAFVTGAAALILSQNNTLTPYEVKTKIISSSHQLSTLINKCKGAGIIDIVACLIEK